MIRDHAGCGYSLPAQGGAGNRCDVHPGRQTVHDFRGGTDFELDIEGLEGISSDEFLWDPDLKKWTGTWASLPPAAPGIVIPKGRGNGVMAVDGFLLYEPAYDH